jgi:thiol:disulfide interchange protein
LSIAPGVRHARRRARANGRTAAQRKRIWMTKRIIGVMIGLLILAGIFGGQQATATSSASQINWHTYKEGTEQARRQKKNVVIYFYADWCTYCVQMEKETFSDPSVIDFLNNKAIAIRIDVDHEKRIARQFGVRGLPATFLLLSNGHQVGPLPGFIPPRSYLAMLSRIFSQS